MTLVWAMRFFVLFCFVYQGIVNIQYYIKFRCTTRFTIVKGCIPFIVIIKYQLISYAVPVLYIHVGYLFYT